MVALAYERYDAGLRARNLLDFDDLLLYGLRLLRAAPFLCQRFRCVLVDEVRRTRPAARSPPRRPHANSPIPAAARGRSQFQDTSELQYDITVQLAHVHQSLTVVGALGAPPTQSPRRIIGCSWL